LYLEVWTDGTISPADAVSQSAEILTEQLSPFISYPRLTQAKEEVEAGRPAISEELYNMPVEQLNLSVRTLNCLRRGGIATVGEVISKGEKELMQLRNFGLKSRKELEDRIASLGLALRSESKAEEAAEESTEQLEEQSESETNKV